MRVSATVGGRLGKGCDCWKIKCIVARLNWPIYSLVLLQDLIRLNAGILPKAQVKKRSSEPLNALLNNAVYEGLPFIPIELIPCFG